MNAGTRYTATAIWLHWLMAVLLLGQIVFGFLLDDLAPRSTPARAGMVNLHKSFGIALGLLLVARLAWRLAHRPPPSTPALRPGEWRAARWTHAAMYFCMAAIPLCGYIASNFSRYGVTFFGMAWPPWGPARPQVYALFNGAHDVLSYVLCALIAGHVLAALKHAWIDRDGLFSRIWI